MGKTIFDRFLFWKVLPPVLQCLYLIIIHPLNIFPGTPIHIKGCKISETIHPFPSNKSVKLQSFWDKKYLWIAFHWAKYFQYNFLQQIKIPWCFCGLKTVMYKIIIRGIIEAYIQKRDKGKKSLFRYIDMLSILNILYLLKK